MTPQVQALVASALREVCSGKDFPFVDRVESATKGFEEPVRMYVVHDTEDRLKP